jgi:hypothetical protein
MRPSLYAPRGQNKALNEFEDAQGRIAQEGDDLRIRPTQRLLNVIRRAVAES